MCICSQCPDDRCPHRQQVEACCLNCTHNKLLGIDEPCDRCLDFNKFEARSNNDDIKTKPKQSEISCAACEYELLKRTEEPCHSCGAVGYTEFIPKKENK